MCFVILQYLKATHIFFAIFYVISKHDFCIWIFLFESTMHQNLDASSYHGCYMIMRLISLLLVFLLCNLWRDKKDTVYRAISSSKVALCIKIKLHVAHKLKMYEEKGDWPIEECGLLNSWKNCYRVLKPLDRRHVGNIFYLCAHFTIFFINYLFNEFFDVFSYLCL